jgi:hypothetical protein
VTGLRISYPCLWRLTLAQRPEPGAALEKVGDAFASPAHEAILRDGLDDAALTSAATVFIGSRSAIGAESR